LAFCTTEAKTLGCVGIQIQIGQVLVDDRKSTSGYVFSLGMGAVTWTSKKQHAVALSSTEAKISRSNERSM
jgi:hypothetical protein